MLRLTRSKAQSTAEYAIVIALVIAAAVGMQIYVKRGLQAKVKDAVDYNDKAATMMTGLPYEPDYNTSEMDPTSETHEKVKTNVGGEVVRSTTGEGNVSGRTGTQVILAPETP